MEKYLKSNWQYCVVDEEKKIVYLSDSPLAIRPMCETGIREAVVTIYDDNDKIIKIEGKKVVYEFMCGSRITEGDEDFDKYEESSIVEKKVGLLKRKMIRIVKERSWTTLKEREPITILFHGNWTVIAQ